MSVNSLKKFSSHIRLLILDAIEATGSSHVGSCFSIVDILSVLYNKVLHIDPKKPLSKDRDVFVLSKGHAALALYTVLAEKKFFDKKMLGKYAVNGTDFAGHTIKNCFPGVETSSGSLGHGLSITSGMALAAKRLKSKRKFYCLVGDGECNEGSVWEAIMFAAQNRLDNLTLIVDYNQLQGMGVSKNIIGQENLAERLRAFGWDTYEVDGHNFLNLVSAFRKKPNTGKPKAIVAHTVKGRGVSFMENNNGWHYKCPTQEQYELAKKEISASL